MAASWITAYELDLDLDSMSPEPEENPTPAPPRETTPTPHAPPEDANPRTGLSPQAVSSMLGTDVNVPVAPVRENPGSEGSGDKNPLPDSLPDGPDEADSQDLPKSKSASPDRGSHPDRLPDGTRTPSNEPAADATKGFDRPEGPDVEARIPWDAKGKSRAVLPASPAALPHAAPTSSPGSPTAPLAAKDSSPCSTASSQHSRTSTPPRRRLSLEPRTNAASQTTPPSRLSLPDTTPSASKPSTPPLAQSPISVASSPVRGPSTRAPLLRTGRVPDVRHTQQQRVPDVDLTVESDGDERMGAEEPTERVLGRLYNYPLPPDLPMLPARPHENGRPVHASDAAFWATYGQINDFDTFIRRIAKESDAVPALPRHMYSTGVEMALTHASVYTRHVQNARRVVAAQELAARTTRNLIRVRELQDRLQALNTPNAPEDAETGTPNGPACSFRSIQNASNTVHQPVVRQARWSRNTSTSGSLGVSGQASGGGSGQASGSGSGQASGGGSGKASGSGSGSASGSGSGSAGGRASSAKRADIGSTTANATGKRKRRGVIDDSDDDESDEDSPPEKVTRLARKASIPPPPPPPPTIKSGWVEERWPHATGAPKRRATTVKKPRIAGLHQNGGESGSTSAPVGESGSGSAASGSVQGGSARKQKRPVAKDYF